MAGGRWQVAGVRCPWCSELLPGGTDRCPSCGLLLAGPVAADLWTLDQQLLALTRRRGQLLSTLRGESGQQDRRVAGAEPGMPKASGPVGRPWTGQRILLGIGALLVLVAAAVFLAVTWSVLGVAGQLLVMAGLTVLADVGATRLLRRDLRASAETLGVLAVSLAGVDLAGAYTLDLAGIRTVGREWFTAAAVALLGGTCVLAGRDRRRPYAYAVAAAVLVPAVPLLVVEAANPGPLVTATITLAASALTALAASWHRGAVRVLLLLAALGYLLSTWLVVAEPVLDDPLLGAGGIGVAISLSASAGAWAWCGLQRGPGSTRAPVLSLVASVAAVVTVVGAAVQADPTRVGLAVLAVIAVAGAEALSCYVARATSPTPLHDAHLGDLRSPGPSGIVSSLVPALRLLAGVGLVVAAVEYLGDVHHGAHPPLWFALLAALAVCLAAVGAAWRSAGLHGACAACAVILGGVTGVVASAPAGLSVTCVTLVGVSALAAGAAARRRHHGIEEHVLVLGWAALVVTVLFWSLAEREHHVQFTSLALAVTGLAALAYGLVPRRGWFAAVGAVSCSGATWVLLADVSVHVVEAYSLPLAVLVGAIGLVRLHRDPATPSWLSVGPAFSIALLPSALASVDDPSLLRPLFVLGVGALVLVFGVRARLQSPVVVGAVALAVVAVSQLAPYAVGLPRWASFGAVGLLLLVLGARYEQRRRDARTALTWLARLD